MSIVFFEGFNHDNNDAIKLDSLYWSSPDMTSITFGNARTSNGVYLPNSIYSEGLAGHKILDLANFNSPLSSSNAFGVGFWVSSWGIKADSRLISFSNAGSELLSVNVISTANGLAFEILQNSVSKGTYLFSAVVGYNYGIWNNLAISSDVYLEFYIDAKNTNILRIRINGMDMINSLSSTSTSIVGFTNIDKISLYGTHNQWNGSQRVYDDFYLSDGSTIENTLLGKDVRIYRINPESNSSTMEWSANRNWGPPADLGSNDGDNSYYFTDGTNKTALFNMNNLPVSSGSVGGIKILNSARKVAGDVSFTNVYSPSNGQPISNVGPTHTVNAASYQYFNSFALKNPSTNSDWTINEINDLQLGVKKLS